MLRQVEQWIPPTADHFTLKKFMIEQLKTSIDFDCSYSDYIVEPVDDTILLQEYEKRLESVDYYINYYDKEYKEEVERVTNANNWIKALYQSFGKPIE